MKSTVICPYCHDIVRVKEETVKIHYIKAHNKRKKCAGSLIRITYIEQYSK